MVRKRDSKGTYTIDLTGLNPGTYHLTMDSDDYVIPADKQEFTFDGKPVSINLDYYTVTIDAEDHITSPSGGTTQPTELIHLPVGAKINVSAAAEPGYHFDGYSVTGVPPEGFVTFDPQEADQSELPVCGDAKITAHAAANVYTVKFDPNGNNVTGTMADQYMVYDQPQNLFANRFKRTGGTFTGWNTKKDGSGDAITDKQSVKNLTTEQGYTVTLYAQWDMEKYAIDYDLAGGTLPSGKDNPTEYTAATPTFKLNAPEKEDHEFTGWVGTDLKQPAKEVTIEEGSTGDRDYAVLWKIKQFTVTFVDNGGTGVDKQIVPIHQKAQKPENPTREGYTFQGWCADQGLTKTFDFNQEITKDTNVYAKWKAEAKPKPKAKQTGVLIAKVTAKGKKGIVISWNKVKGAKGYDIFLARCDGKEGTKGMKKVKTVKAGKTLKWTKTGLKKKTAYKAYVKAYTVKSGKKKYIKTSPLTHSYTSGASKKYSNAKTLTVNKKKVTLKKGKTFRIKGKVTRVKKSKKLMPATHVPTLRYISDNKKVATVSRAGKITAKAKGTCRIYVYAHNGVHKTIEITVK